MDAILRTVNDGDCDDSAVGYISKEAPEEKLLEKWAQLINSSNFQLSDITNGLADLFAMKEPSELTNAEKSANLPASARNQFVVPKLEKVIDEENDVTHHHEPILFKQPFPPFQEDAESVPDPHVPSVPETQPTKQPKKSSKKKRALKITTAQIGPINWTEDEEAALTRAWISIATDDLNATRPSDRGFWERVLEHFHEAMGMGIYRNNDALSGKWRDIKIKVTKFNDIHNHLSAQHKKEGNDFDVFNTALEQYRRENGGKPFALLKAWEVMKNAPEWVLAIETPSQTGKSKRSKICESNDYTVNLDMRKATESKNVVDEIHVEEPPRCPDVRDKFKLGESSLGKKLRESNDLHYFKEKIDEFLQIQKQMMELKRDQQMLTDMQVLQLSTSNVEGEDLETMLAVKRAIREKYKKCL